MLQIIIPLSVEQIQDLMLLNVRIVLALAILVFNAPAIRCRKTEVHHSAKTYCGYTNLHRDTRQCWRCGQYGHISTSCAIRTDFMKPPGNFQGPLSGGRW